MKHTVKLPEAFADRMKTLLKEDYDAYVDSFTEPAISALRINTLKTDCAGFEKLSPWKLSQIPWTENGFYYETGEEITASKHPFYYAGAYYLQEPSAMAPAQILPVEPGDKVLDLCAAPGGKSTELAAKLKGKGVLVCNDISASRAKALLKNIELFGITNSIILNETPERMKSHFEEYFDKILIDAPCSGEGMFRKESSMMKNWEEKGTAPYCEMQQSILTEAVSMLKPGGLLLYSTCTFSPEEDEAQVLKLLESGEFTLVDIRTLPIYTNNHLENYFDTGHPEWIQSNEKALEGCIRLWPHRLKGEGHFTALLKKNGVPNDSEKQKKAKKKSSRVPLCAKEFFSQVTLPEGYEFVMGNENLYLLPEDFPDLTGLHVVRSGLLTGTVKNYNLSVFEPAQAFAMTLSKDTFDSVIELSIDDERVLRYLKGETIEIEADRSGWQLVMCEGFPLGFGKAARGQLKNKYNKGWRMM